MPASKWPCSFQEEETVGTTHRRTPHDDRRRPMPIGNLNIYILHVTGVIYNTYKNFAKLG